MPCPRPARYVRPRRAALLAALFVTPAAVLAEIGDPPVWNLWDGQIGGSTLIQDGNGSPVTICGTADCGGDQSAPAGTPNPTPTHKGVAIFEVDTIGPLRADGTAFFNSAGSGHIDPFLRFQHNENRAMQPYAGQGSHPSGGVEAAYNTDDRGWDNTRNLQEDASFVNQAKDDQGGNTFNHAVRIGDIVQFDANGGYFGFWLDINEPGDDAGRTLLLDSRQGSAGSGDFERNSRSRARWVLTTRWSWCRSATRSWCSASTRRS